MRTCQKCGTKLSAFNDCEKCGWIPELDDEVYYQDTSESECATCGGIDDGHKPGCPDDDSPFARLMRDGYD